jgi:hypothetical protein
VSSQVNFFASAADAAHLHSWLLASFEGLSLITAPRGTRQQLAPIPATLASLSSARFVYLAFPRALAEVSFEPTSAHEFWINPRSSPLIEYVPSHYDSAQNVLKVGRFFWACEPSTPYAEVGTILRWVRGHSRPLPSKKGFRIFPEAASGTHRLLFWVGQPEGNPCSP